MEESLLIQTEAIKSNRKVHLKWFLLAFICDSLHKSFQQVSLYKSHMPFSINRRMALMGVTTTIHVVVCNKADCKLLFSDYFEYVENGGQHICLCVYKADMPLC